MTHLTIKCQCCPHIETSQVICCANQLTGFNMRATLALNIILTPLTLVLSISAFICIMPLELLFSLLQMFSSNNVQMNISGHQCFLSSLCQNVIFKICFNVRVQYYWVAFSFTLK